MERGPRSYQLYPFPGMREWERTAQASRPPPRVARWSFAGECYTSGASHGDCYVLSIWGPPSIFPDWAGESGSFLGLRWTFASFEGRRSFFLFLFISARPTVRGQHTHSLSLRHGRAINGISALGNRQLAQFLAARPHGAPKARSCHEARVPHPPNEKRKGFLRNPLILDMGCGPGILTTATSSMPCQSRRCEPITCLSQGVLFSSSAVAQGENLPGTCTEWALSIVAKR